MYSPCVARLAGCVMLLGACEPLSFPHRCDGGRCSGDADSASLPDGAAPPDGFVPGDCHDGQRNAFETGVDCGGTDCTACPVAEGCERDTDCMSNFCFAGSCRPDSCRNATLDGNESDIGCGGDCRPCDGAKMCGSDDDCASGVCTAAQRCDGPSCSDAARNGDESDVDCGGERCAPCALGAGCETARDCGSEAQCVDAVCVDTRCSDGAQNNGETDVDCAGSCEPCGAGLACTLDGDCASGHCVAMRCVNGPSAGFELSARSGAAPLVVSASSLASAGDAPIVEVLYDWDDGAGLEPHDSYRFVNGGSFRVQQRVRDAHGIEATAAVDLSVSGFVPVRFDALDHSANVFLSSDRLAVEQRGVFSGGARSSGVVTPGSGVFYFEARRLIERTGFWGFGVATATAALDAAPGSGPESMGLTTMGDIQGEGSTCTPGSGFDAAIRDFGFVVDYRGANPKIHVLMENAGSLSVRRSCVMNVSAPLHVFYYGARYVIGFQGSINTGSDTTNFPFQFSSQRVVDALTAAGEAGAAAALVPGFGQTRARPADGAPQLTAPASQSLALGSSVTLDATAMDMEDGVLTSRIVWTDTASQHHAPLRGFGGSFTFSPSAPSALGRHPFLVSVRDTTGRETSSMVVLTVTGALPQVAPVRLSPDALGGQGVALSGDGLSARFEGLGKYGIRANQGIYGTFWYFEAHREQVPGNQGVGLVIGDGALNPYHFEEVPWSCSINFTGSTWRNLISLADWPQTNADYGFAVDYRGEHPTVYVLIGNALHKTLTLDDVWVPLYPMVYGNPTETAAPDADVTLNFGATPFKYDPRPALGASASGLELRWGESTPAQL